MKVKIAKPYFYLGRSFEAGTTIDVPERLASALVERGIAKMPRKRRVKQKKIEVAAERVKPRKRRNRYEKRISK